MSAPTRPVLSAMQVLVAAATGRPCKHRCLVRVAQVRPDVGGLATHRSWVPALAAQGVRPQAPSREAIHGDWRPEARASQMHITVRCKKIG